ncbi:MAG: hypothetical protein AAF485_15865 [Chloroflexota bacterium]
MNHPIGTSAACTQCAAPLETPFAVRQVTCSYCSTAQDNPQPLPVGQEVMLPRGQGSYKLGRVIDCISPDKIEVEDEEDVQSRQVLEDLIPVTKDGIEANMRVFWRTGKSWKSTWTTKVSGQSYVVKHPNSSFQDNFFNKTVTIHDVRIPVQAELQETRTALQGILDRAKGDPKKFAFNIVWYGVLVFILYRVIEMFLL